MNSLRWKFNRLSAMTPREMLWRGMKTLQTGIESCGHGLAFDPPPPNTDQGNNWLCSSPSLFDAQAYRAAADKILAGRFKVFALHDVHLDFPPDWNRDPKTGVGAPLRFGKRIDYRNERLVGNIKYLWEINRHYELVTLAQAACLTGERTYAQAALALLDSWFAACPYPRGQAWTSSLEAAIRLLNWSVAWQLLHASHPSLFSDAEGQSFRRRWLNAVYQHCHFIAGHLSLHSSANNHLFGEYMGLFIGASTWPCWNQSRAWTEQARKGLEQEAINQNAPDGVNREQAFWYHHEVADMMLLCMLCGRKNGVVFSDAFRQRIEKMLTFIHAVMDVRGNVPMIGDSDDAVMVRFSQEEGFHVYRSLLASGAVLFSRGDFKDKAVRFDDKSRWLLGNEGAEAFSALTSSNTEAETRRAFPYGGYFILGHRFGRPDEVKLVADAGPLGYLSIAAHGHADALAFTLSAGGRPLLIDPGTYAYHTDKMWRNYFRGTSAHNTVRVDGLDQSEPGGNFLWLRKANARCERWKSGATADEFVGVHDGYRRLPDPVTHRRRLVFDKENCILLVEDVLECRDAHVAEIFWHFPDNCRIRQTGASLSVSVGEVSLDMSMPDCPANPVLAIGRTEPPLGWISHEFDAKTPSPTALWTLALRGTTRFLTRIRISDASSLHDDCPGTGKTAERMWPDKRLPA